MSDSDKLMFSERSHALGTQSRGIDRANLPFRFAKVFRQSLTLQNAISVFRAGQGKFYGPTIRNALFALAARIIPIVVFAVYGVGWRWSSRNYSGKSFKGSHALADSNAASAIIAKMAIIYVGTTLQDTMPNLILKRAGLSVCKHSRSCLGGFVAATRSSVGTLEGSRYDVKVRTANAFAEVDKATPRSDQRYDGQFSKRCSDWYSYLGWHVRDLLKATNVLARLIGVNTRWAISILPQEVA